MLVIKSAQPVNPESNISLDESSFSPVEKKVIDLMTDAANRSGVTLRVVGGWVRDKLLGLQPKDIDVTVEGTTGEKFGNFLKQYAHSLGIGNQVSDAQTTTERAEQIKKLQISFLRIFGEDIEITGLRKETYEPGNRVPVIEEGTPEEDAYRRDLTINSMFYNPHTKGVEDFTGKGYDDLATMTMRTPLDPKQTFLQDPVRVIRVLRFYSRYDKATLDPELEAIINNPEDMREIHAQIYRRLRGPEGGPGISAERFAMEFSNLMQSKRPEKGIKYMQQTGLLSDVLNLPENFNPLNMDQRNRYHQLNLFEHTLEVIKHANVMAEEYGLDKNTRGLLNMAALFHDLGKLDPRSHIQKDTGDVGYSGDPNMPGTLTHQQSSTDLWDNFSASLKQISNKDKELVSAVVGGHMMPHGHINDPNVSDKTLRKFMRKNPYGFFMYILAGADARAKNDIGDPELSRPYQEGWEYMQNLPVPPQQGKSTDLLNGGEILGFLPAGISPKPPPGLSSDAGKPVGIITTIKEYLRDVQDEYPNLTKDEAVMKVNEWTQINSGYLEEYMRV